MKRSKLKCDRWKKADYFKDALQRLENEAGLYISFVVKRNSEHQTKVGFWSGIRLLMPVIESLSKVTGETPEVLLRDHLNISAPFITWDMFRNALVHGDHMQYVIYQTETIGWGITIDGREHSCTSEHIHLDVVKLYEDLKAFLEQQVLKDEQTLVSVVVGRVYQSDQQNITDEIDRLE